MKKTLLITGALLVGLGIGYGQAKPVNAIVAAHPVAAHPVAAHPAAHAEATHATATHVTADHTTGPDEFRERFEIPKEVTKNEQ